MVETGHVVTITGFSKSKEILGVSVFGEQTENFAATSGCA